MGQAQRAQVVPVGIGHATGVAQRQRLYEPRSGMRHLRGNHGAAAFTPGLQTLCGQPLTCACRITNRAIAGNAPLQCLPLGIEAARIDP
ncbi:hypothetical protein SSKA14_3918 [Stenotrophomonas sp. SKA14]|nr:hypothetical protein SSKA14_3918 [Stenotrophomonas sp. SKA14]